MASLDLRTSPNNFPRQLYTVYISVLFKGFHYAKISGSTWKHLENGSWARLPPLCSHCASWPSQFPPDTTSGSGLWVRQSPPKLRHFGSEFQRDQKGKIDRLYPKRPPGRVVGVLTSSCGQHCHCSACDGSRRNHSAFSAFWTNVLLR